MVVLTVCKSCGELKRRKFRSDAQGWLREHEKVEPKHEVSIVERKLEAAPKPKSKSEAAKPAKKGKPVAKAKATKPAAQAASAA
jgi:hypothetical protein